MSINVVKIYLPDDPITFKYQLEIPNVNLNRDLEVRGKNFMVKKCRLCVKPNQIMISNLLFIEISAIAQQKLKKLYNSSVWWRKRIFKINSHRYENWKVVNMQNFFLLNGKWFTNFQFFLIKGLRMSLPVAAWPIQISKRKGALTKSSSILVRTLPFCDATTASKMVKLLCGTQLMEKYCYRNT